MIEKPIEIILIIKWKGMNVNDRKVECRNFWNQIQEIDRKTDKWRKTSRYRLMKFSFCLLDISYFLYDSMMPTTYVNFLRSFLSGLCRGKFCFVSHLFSDSTRLWPHPLRWILPSYVSIFLLFKLSFCVSRVTLSSGLMAEIFIFTFSAAYTISLLSHAYNDTPLSICSVVL